MTDSHKKRLLVIGGVAAGTKAAARARRISQDWEVTLVTRDSDISYAGCGLPYFLSGVIKERRELVVKTPEEFEADTGVHVLTRHEALAIDAAARQVQVKNLDTGAVVELPYDRLVLATGASPCRPPVPGIDLQGVFPLRTVRDAVSIREAVAAGAKRAVVVGGGFIGLEAAENLHLAGLQTTVIEAASQILPGFDPEIALSAEAHVTDQGLDVRCGERVQHIAGEAGRVTSVHTDAGVFPADVVIWATGIRPNVELARQSGIALGPYGAVKVDEHMQTSAAGIYAVGDCAETVNQVTKAAAWSPMGSTANKAGRVTGAEVVGHPSRGQFTGVLGTTVVKLFGLALAKTGLSAAEAARCGFRPVTALVPANDRAHYFPGHKPIIIKLVVDADTRRVLGGQIIGEGVVDKPIDTLATLIGLGGTVDQLSTIDLAYAPPFSTAISPVILAAHVVQNKLDGRVNGVGPVELHDRLKRNEDLDVIDVRSEPEFVIGAIPGAKNIPFGELAERAGELSRDRPIVLVCKVGKRAYLASLLLKQLGFTNVSILDGGMAGYPYEIE